MLLQSYNVYSHEIKKRLSISIRTVRMEIQSLEEILNAVDIGIKSSPKYGYYLLDKDKHVGKEVLDDLVLKAKSYDLPDTTNERLLFLLFLIAFSETKYTTINSLSNTMYVSTSSIVKNLKELDTYLKSFKSVKIQTSYKGIQLCGSEPIIRHILSETLNYRTYGSILIARVLRFIFGEDYKAKYKYLQTHIPNLLYKNQYYLIDKSIEGFIIDVFISIKREEKGFHLCQSQLKINKSQFIEDLRDSLEQKGITLNEKNYYFLDKCLKTKRAFYRNNSQETVDDTVKEITRSFLLDVDQNFNTTFTSDIILTEKISIHIGKLLHRLLQGHFEHNPALKDIKKYYPQSMDMAKLLNSHLFERYKCKVNEHELGYIAIYLTTPVESLKAVVISDIGDGIADNMVRQLKENCGDRLKIIGKVSLSYLRAHRVDVDLIISASRIFNVNLPKHIQIVYVNYILQDSDIKRLQSLLSLDSH